jgi:hypothetical protein
MDQVAERDKVQTTWWQEKQDKVMDRSRCRVEANNQSLHTVFGWFTPQNQHRAGMTWWPSHEWDYCGGYIESAGFAAVHHKTIGVTWLSHKTNTGGSAGRDGI